MDKSFHIWRPHPWHGLETGPEPPRLVNAYIEITPFDLVKYEIDKPSGYLMVDRPQRASSQPPALYGFIPRTLCGDKFGKLSPHAKRGDGDPLDICVLSERSITKSEILLKARVIGGIQMIDNGEADDKIVAVLENDSFWDGTEDINDLPKVLVERLTHYFSTYNMVGDEPSHTIIDKVYGKDEAYTVISAAMEDYRTAYANML